MANPDDLIFIIGELYVERREAQQTISALVEQSRQLEQQLQESQERREQDEHESQ